MDKAFARKLSAGTAARVIDDEVQVITKLCENGAHCAYCCGSEIGEIRDSRFVFINMELCDLNLAEYIHCTTQGLGEASAPTYFIKDRPPPFKAQQIWNVMLHIAKG